MSFKQFVREMSFTTVFPTLSSSPFDHHSLQPSPVHLPCDCTIPYIGFRQSSLNTKRQKYPVRVNQWWLSTPSPLHPFVFVLPTPLHQQCARVPEYQSINTLSILLSLSYLPLYTSQSTRVPERQPFRHWRNNKVLKSISWWENRPNPFPLVTCDT